MNGIVQGLTMWLEFFDEVLNVVTLVFDLFRDRFSVGGDLGLQFTCVSQGVGLVIEVFSDTQPPSFRPSINEEILPTLFLVSVNRGETSPNRPITSATVCLHMCGVPGDK